MGTREGALKAVQTIKEKYGKDFYSKIGKKGGANGRGEFYTGGFASSTEFARECGRKGGKISKRGPAKKKEVVND